MLAEAIVNDGQLVRPELVIVTDGEDNVSALMLAEFDATRLHAFVVVRKNAELVQLAQSTGGIGIETASAKHHLF